jgi:UDP-N-acetylmuramyl tripeptide synthase
VASGVQGVPIRTRLAAVLGRGAGAASRRLGRGLGGTVAGRVALAVSPRAIADLTSGRSVVLVSGTNGKTTTTAYCAAALGTRESVLTNAHGDNLLPGLASALVAGAREGTATVVLEVDEFALATAIAQTQPTVIVLLNLSRDQLDRSGEVAGHVTRWTEALAAAPTAVLVANADDPLIVAVVTAARPQHDIVQWVSMGGGWRGDSLLCSSCGAPLSGGTEFRCSQCGFGRPAASWVADETGLHHLDGPVLAMDLGLPGRANRANAAMAVATAAALGVAPEAAIAALGGLTSISGRYLTATLGEHRVQFLLAKNPAGWMEALDVIRAQESPVVVSINARSADGKDPSWLWDAQFELLRGRTVVVTGDRRWDVAVRLEYAEVPHQVLPDPRSAVACLPPGDCVFVANYTAFRDAQDDLLQPQRAGAR